MDEFKNLDHYLSLPYTIEMVRQESGTWSARLELPGCITEGDTPEEATKMIFARDDRLD